ncbi:hypothetical protein [Roseovarius sp.]|jgi:hypothetical protein|uniref:hypothetical protein n=1 Tax=Roseovarius sp. TaxID=1486281 RepID=UPI00261BA973|nr:hypothetical protein [Roseovarius sp.]MDM8164757.1 hypothetical protein [Roseovarius sp.]
MKPALALLALSLLPLAAPVQAQSVDVGSLFPTLTYPTPAPEPATRTVTELNR